MNKVIATTKALLLLSSAPLFASSVMAQVASTEVNEEVIDEFGLERKTGRFSWSTNEIIGIGGENSRVSVRVTGVRNPPRTTRIWPQPFTIVQLNGPRLLSEPKPDTTSSIPGAILPNAFNHTVEFPTGSETFKCATDCYSEYLTGSTLNETADGHIYTNQQGIEVHFTALSARIVYPDGRETTYRSGQHRKNNFGFMLKHAAGSIQAINQSIDYCSPTSASLCTGLTKSRTSSFASPSVGVQHIIDPVGGVTKLRWENKTAKLYRRPQGAPATLFIQDVTEKYPLGITLPGSTTEDITINYHPIDANLDTHDDIVVSSITKNGVDATYSYQRVLPQGYPEAEPSASETLENLTGPGSLLSISQAHCDTGDTLACGEVDQFNAIIQTLQELAVLESLDEPPPDPSLNGTNLLELTISASIEGIASGSSFAVIPAGGFANTRRRLAEITDSLGRKTSYIHNQFEEVGGMTLPEGNRVINGYDGRKNLISSSIHPKTGSNAPILTTTYTYLPACGSVPLARCNKPLTITDPKGNVTEYTYNDRGQILTETKPAPSSGAARPKVTNEYTMRTAYIKDASDNAVAAGPAISLLTKSSTCITQSACVGTADEVVTEYDYGPTSDLNNLQLRGITVTAANASGQMETLRTCYQYNYFGERIAETQPKGTGGTCP